MTTKQPKTKRIHVHVSAAKALAAAKGDPKKAAKLTLEEAEKKAAAKMALKRST